MSCHQLHTNCEGIDCANRFLLLCAWKVFFATITPESYLSLFFLLTIVASLELS